MLTILRPAESAPTTCLDYVIKAEALKDQRVYGNQLLDQRVSADWLCAKKGQGIFTDKLMQQDELRGKGVYALRRTRQPGNVYRRAEEPERVCKEIGGQGKKSLQKIEKDQGIVTCKQSGQDKCRDEFQYLEISAEKFRGQGVYVNERNGSGNQCRSDKWPMSS